MPTTLLFVRHSVRNIQDFVELADGNVVTLQSFSKQQLPLYSSPVNINVDGNISGIGWKFSKKLGKLLRKKYKNIHIRASVSTNRAIDTGIAISQGAKIPSITIFNGPIDPLFFPRDFYNYKLPSDALKERQERYDSRLEDIQNVSKTITETFGVKLPKETKITLDKITGLLSIEDKFSNETAFSVLSDIDLEISHKNRKIITQGLAIRQYIDNIPLFVQQQSTNMLKYIIDTLIKNDDMLTILVGNDNPISSLATLLDYKFETDGWSAQYISANSGFLFTLDNDQVKVEFLGLNSKKEFCITPVAKSISLKKFKKFIESKINPLYLNLSDINNVKEFRVL